MQHSKENLFELCLNGCISTKLITLKIKISHLFPARSSLLDIQATIECRFTLKIIRALIITNSYSSILL